MSPTGISDLLKSESRRQYLGATYLAIEISFISKNTADAATMLNNSWNEL